jgi:hypothetical protein
MCQQSYAGYVIPDLTPLGSRLSRTRTGLPCVIPADHRRLIRQGDFRTMKLWLTLFNLYRVLNFPGTLKLKTITKGFEGSFYDLSDSIPTFITLFLNIKSVKEAQSQIRRSRLFQIFDASPFSNRTKDEFSSHFNSVIRSFRGIMSNPRVAQALVSLTLATNNSLLADL